MQINYLRDYPELESLILNGASNQEIRQKYNIPDRTIRKLRCKVRKPEPAINYSEKEGIRSYIIVTHKQVKNEEDLFELSGLDKIAWTITEFQVKVYEGFFKNKNIQQAQVVQMFSVSFKAKQNKPASLAKELIEVAKKELLELAKAVPPKLFTPTTFSLKPSTSKLLVLDIADPHFGKHAYGAELNGENFDLGICRDMYKELVSKILNASSHLTYEKVLFILGNDFLNSDNTMGTTYSGTPQDNDGRHKKVYQVAKWAAIWAIEQCAQIAPTQVLAIQGNHDQDSLFKLCDSVDMYFYSSKHIEVDNTPPSRKFVRFGQVFLGISHGDKMKTSDYPAIMANERPKDFGETRFHEWLKHHLHTDRIELGEYKGFKVRTVPSPTASDLWHYDNGYTCNIRSGVGYVYDREEGYKGQQFEMVIPAIESLTAVPSLVL